MTDVPEVRPYGSWSTPITSALVVQAATGLGDVRVDGRDVWWAERRAQEGGRVQLVRRGDDGVEVDMLPEGWSARTAVHEYGGGAWWVRDGVVWFARWDDQRLHRLAPGDEEPVPLTVTPEVPRGDRWADGDVSPDGEWLVCVREHHPAGGEPAGVVNEIVRMRAIDGGELEVVVHGPDFVAGPRWRPDGGALCWLEWDHPDMPWDSTRLMVGSGSGDAVLVAGGPGESVLQPRWHQDGALWFISDRTGWWNVYRWTVGGDVEPMVVLDGEIGEPAWAFGESRYAFLDDGRVAFAYSQDGFDHLAVKGDGGEIVELDVPYTSIESVQVQGGAVVFVGASPTTEPAVVRVALAGVTPGPVEVLRPPRDLGLDRADLSVPAPVTFPTAGGAVAHGLLYPPTSRRFAGPPGTRPPLLVMIHGGPTDAAKPALRINTQYWTSRGFAVVDMNYRGSTGYGRPYRELMRGGWGVVDVEDCVAAARWLAAEGLVDPDRLCIRGGSAGGFTVLLALTLGDTFAAGASHYGVADLEALARDTHKFESRYLDGLIGPYPERRDLYADRSPINHLDRFDRPLIVLQGLDDPVVPPNQSEMVVAALRAKGVPVAYVPFEGEQHGFRKAENIRRALDAELSFYAQVLGFDVPADEGIEPVAVL
jgi:dipeptidyl aminopeptidase/acylaminoacyl peptidase